MQLLDLGSVKREKQQISYEYSSIQMNKISENGTQYTKS